MNRVGIGIVGAGTNTVEVHIPRLRQIPEAEIVAVANRTRESGERVARAHDIPVVHPDWLELIRDPAVDAVLIGTWPNMHHPVTIAALTADKHVLCEARMAMNAAQAREMLQASLARPHLVTQVVPAPGTLTIDRTIVRLLGEGAVGRPLTLDLEVLGGGYPDPTRPRTWRQDAARSGVNIMSLGIWYESVMRWLGEATEVQAMGTTTIPWRPTGEGAMTAVRIPDRIDVLARTASGVHIHFRIAEWGEPRGSRVVLRGSEGTLWIDNGELSGVLRGESQRHPITIPSGEAVGWRVEQEFVDAILGRGEIELTDFATGVAYMDFTEAASRSMQTGATVHLPLA